MTRDLGLFAQDRWTFNRWTLSGGIRYDSFGSKFPEQAIAGTFFGKSINLNFPEAKNLALNDITPRLGATYDVFGNGKTAVKATLNKYLEGLGTTGFFGADNISDLPNPINRISGINENASRTWTDDGDFRLNCDLNDFAANAECGPLDLAATFGTVVGGTTYDPDVLRGWGKRGFNWEFTSSVQQEILSAGLGVEVQYPHGGECQYIPYRPTTSGGSLELQHIHVHHAAGFAPAGRRWLHAQRLDLRPGAAPPNLLVAFADTGFGSKSSASTTSNVPGWRTPG